MNNFKLLAIGDITVDDFIELENIEILNGKLEIPWGRKIPFVKSTKIFGVGNVGNAAVSASRLGIKSGIITRVGDDDAGNSCLEVLKKDGVDVSNAEKQTGKSTNYHYVLSHKGERTILIRHESFTYENLSVPDGVEMLYVSSIGESGESIHYDIVKEIEKHQNLIVVFQPGTFQIKFGKDKLKDIYKRTDIFICNVEESQLILNTKERDLKKLLLGISDLGPKTTLITDGPNGAYMHEGGKFYFMPIYPDREPPKERTGCGDAFSTTFASYVLKGMNSVESLKRAPINSWSVVQYVGAQEGLLSESRIDELLSEAPSDYNVKEI